MEGRQSNILYLTLFCLNVVNVHCQPTHGAMNEPNPVVCVRLLTEEDAFFDSETGLVFKCSSETCPGILGCQKCCQDLTEKAPGGKVHASQNDGILPPERDPVFLTLLGISFALVLVGFLLAALSCYRSLRHRFVQSPPYSVFVKGSSNGRGTAHNAPENWVKLSGRSCKIFPKGKENLSHGKRVKDQKNSCGGVPL